MKNKNVIVKFSKPEEEFKDYDVGMIIKVDDESKCGGVYSWEDAIKQIKLYFKYLDDEKIIKPCPTCGHKKGGSRG